METEFVLTWYDVAIRLVVAIFIAGAIGMDREFKNRPAGIRTHVLVCVGAAIIALIQKQIEVEAINMALSNPELAGIIRSDPARLIAQVISGIGFLGAGTIIVTKRSISGLTTAASLWTVAGLGLAVGMGYYLVAIAGFIAVMVVLVLIQKVVHLPIVKRVEIQYTDPDETRAYIADYLEKSDVSVKDVEYDLNFSSDTHVYTNIYTIEIRENSEYSRIVEDLSKREEITRIRAVNI